MSIVSRIRDICAEKGMSIKQLEVDVGLGNGTIRRWDDASPSVDRLSKVADYLQTSLDYLATGKLSPDFLSESERVLLHQYRKLTDQQQRDFLGAIRIQLMMDGAEKKADELQEKQQALSGTRAG